MESLQILNDATLLSDIFPELELELQQKISDSMKQKLSDNWIRTIGDARLLTDSRWNTLGLPAVLIEKIQIKISSNKTQVIALPEEYIGKNYFGRERTIKKILETWQTKSVIFIRSPPLTGKSIMAYLLIRYITQNKLGQVHYVPLTEANALNPIPFETIWSRVMPSNSFGDFYFLNQSSYIIFDEVQCMFDHAQSIFWSVMKNAVDSFMSRNLKILCLAGYGSQSMKTKSSTPIQFNQNNGTILDIQSLLLNLEEIKLFYEKTCTVENLKFNDEIWGTLARNTKGHIGFLRIILDLLVELKNDEELKCYLDSFNFHKKIEQSRALAGFKTSLLSESQIELLRSVVLFGTVRHTTSIDDDVNELLKAGYLTTCDNLNTVMFACPLVSKVVQFNLFCGDGKYKLQSETITLKDFMLHALSKLQKEQFKHTLSTNKDNLVHEKFWQNQFFSAASHCLPSGLFISSEVGSSYGLKAGTIDFIVDNKHNWGIEFLIETNNREEHLERFHLVGGKYAPAKFKDYVVVEFIRKDEKYNRQYFQNELEIDNQSRRSKRVLTEKRDDHLWLVFYEPDFSKLIVFLPTGEKIEIILHD